MVVTFLKVVIYAWVMVKYPITWLIYEMQIYIFLVLDFILFCV